jgi:hypothetical protein
LFASVTADIIFYETNDSNAPLTKPGDGDFVRKVGTDCDSFTQVFKSAPADITKNIGDTVIENGILDPTETWQWKCTITLGSATTTSATEVGEAIGHGINGVFDVTFCSSGAAVQAAKLGDNTTTATAICDSDEHRKVTLKIE